MAKKKKAGLFLTPISVILGIAGVVAYVINCGTDYYAKMGIDAMVVCCIAAAVLIQVVLIALGLRGQKTWMDVLPVAACILLMAGTLIFTGSRVESIATIMTFEKNDANMADLASALAGIGLCLGATVIGVVSSFFDITETVEQA